MLTKRNNNLPHWNFKHNSDLRCTECPKISMIEFMIVVCAGPLARTVAIEADNIPSTAENVMYSGPCTGIKTESTRSWSNNWTKTYYQDYLHCIANFCTTVLNIFATPNVENEC